MGCWLIVIIFIQCMGLWCVSVCVKVNGMCGFGNNKLPYSDQPDPLGH